MSYLLSGFKIFTMGAKFAVLHIFNVRITLEIATQNVENNLCCTIVHKKDLDIFATVALSRC